MATTLFNEFKSVIIVFDAALESARDYSAKVTSHPVETGVEIADHVTLENPKFTLKGVVSDAAFLTPFEQIASFANRAASGITNAIASTQIGASALKGLGIDVVAKDSRSMSAYQDLQFLYRERQFLTLQFGDEPPYNNLILTKLNVPKDKNVCDAFIFDLEFEQVRVVSSRYTTVVAKRVAKPLEEGLSGKKAKGGSAGGSDSFNTRPEEGSIFKPTEAQTQIANKVVETVGKGTELFSGDGSWLTATVGQK